LQKSGYSKFLGYLLIISKTSILNILLGVGMLYSYACMFPRKEGGKQVLAGLVSDNQTVEFLLRTPWSALSDG
jgi:hypothetical protein